jgi:hypothetical protein
MLHQDETEFGSRPGARAALSKLRNASGPLVYRVKGNRIDFLLGRRLGGFALDETRNAEAVRAFVTRFYGEHDQVFNASPLAKGSLRVERVRFGVHTVADVQQFIDGIPVIDARWTLVFNRDGYLTQVTGSPVDPARITVSRRSEITSDDAIALAVKEEALTRDDVEARAELVIEGRTNRLLWMVELNGRRHAALFRGLSLDAHRGVVVERADRCEHAVVSIPVRHYSHPAGIKDSSGRTAISNINVDSTVVDPPKDNLPTMEFFSMLRLGSGRSRIWNAKPTGSASPPQFSRTISAERNYFTKLPGATGNNVFNEQQTYFWAQTLKTAVDEWGREANDYGHYPVDPSRAVNVEIVVNGDAAMEDPWNPSGDPDNPTDVMHGYFRGTAPGSWFGSSAASVPAVFFFNSSGNSDSPQYFGPEYSSSYSIIAHEVGHFISWQYGSWQGPADTILGRSFSEGHSMVLAGLLGKRQFGTALAYEESEYVTTGGGGQWSHFVYGQPALKYSSLDCSLGQNPYSLAWPFVQAMWRLMNNKDIDGNPIWGSADAALSNTADLFMYSLHSFTNDSTMTWDKLCLALTARVYERVTEGLEKEPIGGQDPYCAIVKVFGEHGLLSECKNSPQ